MARAQAHPRAPWRSPLITTAALGSLLGFLLGLPTGCMHPGKAPTSTTPPTGQALSGAKHQDGRPPRTAALWKDELRNLRSIPELWNALNRHQDQLGRSLALLEAPRVHRVIVDAPPRPVVPDPGADTPGPRRPTTPRVVEPAPPPIDRRATVRGRAGGLCHRACRHVIAICYAASRICRIAGRLGDWAAQQACTRAQDRCQDARRTAQRRCPRCR